MKMNFFKFTYKLGVRSEFTRNLVAFRKEYIKYVELFGQQLLNIVTLLETWLVHTKMLED